MNQDLANALKLLAQLKKLLHPHFSKFHWPVFYEDLDYLTEAIRNIQADLAAGNRLPP